MMSKQKEMQAMTINDNGPSPNAFDGWTIQPQDDAPDRHAN